MAGIWRELDRTPVTAGEATREWALNAHDILEEIAPRYGRSIAFTDVAHEVQRRSGIRTDLPPASWLPDVLSEVATRCQESGEPRLTEFVDPPGQTPSSVVSAARLEAHKAYGAKLPNPDAPARRRTTRAKATTGTRASSGTPRPAKAARPTPIEERRRPVCPTCFVELPATGICDDCS
ncbi:hypothetical protein [Enemella evansiae]|uniref:hypothetical protein n=1 Tax=Enemella evansiae TaxID=2016499 RepID=UPI0015C665E7|nr:hypothetical protein [Enemella evansiae]